MGETTGISWCDHTFNSHWGCEKPLVQIGGKQVVSPECVRCYAETWDKRCGGKNWGRTAPRRFFGEKHWREPLKWNRDARESGERRRVFCLSMGDICEDRRDLDPMRASVGELIAATESLDWMLLTKRADLLETLIPPEVWRLPNVWPGVTAGVQATANLRIPYLVRLKEKYPHLIAWVSGEPLLEAVDWDTAGASVEDYEGGDPGYRRAFRTALIDLLIIGGESGGGARPFNTEWAKYAIEWGRETGCHVWIKQLGAHTQGPEQSTPDWVCRLNAHGSNWDEWPADICVRQMPEVQV
jgi:protein gp37